MSLRTENISLNCKKAYFQTIIENLHVGDVKSTQLVFTLTDGIKEIELPAGKTTAIIHGKKPDGKEIHNECTVENNKIYYTLTAQDTAVSGIVDYMLDVTVNRDEQYERAYMPTFRTRVSDRIYSPAYRELETEPDNWETEYKNYYRKEGNAYIQIDDNVCPTFAPGTFYVLVDPPVESASEFLAFYSAFNRINELDDIVEQAVDDYIDEHPIEGNLEKVKNKKSSIGNQSQTGDSDTNYPTVGAVRDFVNLVKDDLEDYIDDEIDSIPEVTVDSGFSLSSTNPVQNKVVAAKFNDVVRGKADKSTTLAGYGITDAYSKAELNIKSAKSYGAKGDGVTDDTTALQTWLNDVALNGGIAYLPTGQYKITEPLNVTWTDSGDTAHNHLQRIIGDGCTSYNGDDNSCIVAYGIPANHAALELISNAGNTWGTQAELLDFAIYCDPSCDPMSFCLMYGDARQFTMRKMKLKGYNDILCRCGSTPPSGTDSYEHINITIENCDLLVRSNATNGTRGFSFLPESVGYSRSYSMLDNLYLNNCMIGGVFVIHVNNLVVDNCMVAIEDIMYKVKEETDLGRLSGFEIDYATGLLIVETASTIIRNLYCEDFRRAIDIAPICGNIRNVLIEGCYFNPGSNQGSNNNSDYGVLIRTGKSGAKVVYTEISHNVFRHDGDSVAFTVAAIKNEASEKLLCYANAGRPNIEADQIVSQYGEFITERELVNPTKTSELINDSGFLTQHQDISGKVDKVDGKGLSTNDYTTAEKNKLASLEPGNSIWETSTAPAAPDTEQNLGYGFAISTLTGADRDVQIGDMILYSYYYYNVTDIVNSVAYAESRVSIRGAKGATGAKGEQGDDYVLTAQDKTEIANEVVSILPVYNGGVQ